MISRSSINYSDILIMERNLPVFADSVNYYFQEEVHGQDLPLLEYRHTQKDKLFIVSTFRD